MCSPIVERRKPSRPVISSFRSKTTVRAALAAGEDHQLADEADAALGGAPDLLDVGGGRGAGRHATRSESGVVDDHPEDVVEVVRDPAGELADHLQRRLARPRRPPVGSRPGCSLEQAPPHRGRDRSRAVGDAELLVEVVEVGLDRRLGQVQLLADPRAVRPSASNRAPRPRATSAPAGPRSREAGSRSRCRRRTAARSPSRRGPRRRSTRTAPCGRRPSRRSRRRPAASAL